MYSVEMLKLSEMFESNLHVRALEECNAWSRDWRVYEVTYVFARSCDGDIALDYCSFWGLICREKNVRLPCVGLCWASVVCSVFGALIMH